MVKTIRVGFIGAGGIAGAHIANLKKIDGVEVVALADPSDAAMQKRIQEHALKDVETFKDYRKLLVRKDIDAVSICTPNSLHFEPTVRALKAGKHVMVEKPLAMNVREGRVMCETARRMKRVLSIGFQHRFRPETQYLKRLVDEGRFGKILYCRSHALRRRGIPSWGVFGQKELQGGGPMIDIGVHILEASLFVMGMPEPVSASGQCYTYIGNRKPEAAAPWGNWDHKTYTVEDLACGFVRFGNGMTLSVEASFAAHIEKDVFAMTLMGTRGGATFGDDGLKVFTDMDGKMVNIAPAFVGQGDAFEVKMRSWIETIRGRPNPSPGEDGLKVQKILDGVYASAEANREVRL